MIRKWRAIVAALSASLFLFWIILLVSTPIRVYEGKGFSRLTYDRKDKILDMQVAPDGRYRSKVSLDYVPQRCIDAATGFEDRHFYWHPGVDPTALIRALFSIYSEHRNGGSTLTMQVVRLRAGFNTKSVLGKLRQIWDALVLERHLSKREILQAYFTFAPYGGGVEGLAAASATYFKKSPRDLTPGECAALAVLPQAPTERFSFEGEGFSRAFTRVSDILKLPPSERSLNFPRREELNPPHFARHLTAHVLATGGAARTSIDRSLQEDLEQLLKDYVSSRSSFGLKNGAMLVVDGRSGEILSYVGSKDFSDASIDGFVDGVIAKRSPGSLLKPFVYAKAIDEGVIIPESMVTDIPIKLTSYEPENFEHDFLGLISAREALVKSRNVPALLLNAKLANEGLYTLLTGAGIPLSHDANYYGAAVVLGGIEVSLLNVVRLYTAFVSRGDAVPLFSINQTEPRQRYHLFSAESAFLTREMLKTNPSPPGFSGEGIAWKTGTSSGARDAWAVGVIGRIVIGVWLGNFDNQPNANFVGRDLAGPLLFQAVERLKNNKDFFAAVRDETESRTLHLGTATICPESGMMRSAHCPHSKQALIIPGVSPIKECDVHRDGSGATPLYPSEVEDHLKSVGMKLANNHAPDSLSAKMPPHIISPEAGIEYRTVFGQASEVEFRANVDGEVRKVDWYVDDEVVGSSAVGQSFFWKAKPGHFTVRAIDSFGASDAVAIDVESQGN